MRASARRTLWVAVVFCLTLSVFARSLQYSFVWDDRALVVENPGIQGAAPLGEMLSRPFGFRSQGARGSQFWRPLPLLIFRALHAAFGAEPAIFHGAVVLIHAVTAVLLLVVLSAGFPPAAAAWASAWFAVHPLRIESVAWIAGIGDPLCALWLLVTLIAVARYLEGRSAYWVAVAVVPFTLALLSKELAVVFPAFTIALGLLWGRRSSIQRLAPGLVLGGVAALFWIVRTLILPPPTVRFSFAERVFTAPVLLARYLFAMLLPWSQEIKSPMPPIASPAAVPFVASLIALVLIGGACWYWQRSSPPGGGDAGRRRLLGLGLGWGLLFLAPVCWIGFADTLYAERYTYVPSLGVAWLLAAVAAPVFQTASLPRIGPAAAIIVALAGVTSVRQQIWRDEGVLFSHVYRTHPRDTAALRNLIGFEERSGRFADAGQHSEELFSLEPASPDGCFGAGLDWFQAGRRDRARALFARGLEVQPDHSPSLNALGNLALEAGDVSGALGYYRRAAAGTPPNPEAGFNLASTLAEHGSACEARGWFLRVATEADDAGLRAHSAGRARQLDGICR